MSAEGSWRERVRALRRGLEERCATFGRRFGRGSRAVEEWELGRRAPAKRVQVMIARLERAQEKRRAAHQRARVQGGS